MIELTSATLRKIFPAAPQLVIEAFVDKQHVLDAAGINHTRQRLAYFFANIEHECGGFTIPNLTENIYYSAERMAQVWPNRFASAEAVRLKYGIAPGWQKAAFNDIYGSRMGNRPGTDDGSRYIGRGGPQWTGRDGYTACARLTGLPAVLSPEIVCRLDLQPEVCAAFWEWKNLNVRADLGDFSGLVRIWNGGSNGMADRLAKLSGNDPVIQRLALVESARPKVGGLPGAPPTKDPPKEAMDAATSKERQARASGVAVAGVAGGTEAAGRVASPQEGHIPSAVTWSLVCAGVLLVVVAAVIIAKKRRTVTENWK